MKEKPKRDEKKEDGHYCKTVGKKTYLWCPYQNGNNGQWVIHKPSECHNKPKQNNNNKDNSAQANMTAAFNMIDSDYKE